METQTENEFLDLTQADNSDSAFSLDIDMSMAPVDELTI